MSDDLLQRLPYRFRDESLFRAALTHPSRQIAQKKASDYERLEFLGDRVLSLVIAEWLFEKYPDESEGELAKRHASLVNREILAQIALNLQLEAALLMVNADDLQRGRTNILSDALEALLGAIYRDAGKDGYEISRGIIRTHWQSFVEGHGSVPQDAKSALQEWAQARGLPLPLYELVTSSGLAHAPRYIMRVTVTGLTPVEAEGASKREAEKKAATLLYDKIKNT